MKNKKEKWMFICFLAIVIVPAIVIGLIDADLDPFFHYHKPYTDKYFYRLDNERSQNYGIITRFDYDAVITGTSMTQNFKSSKLDSLFGTHSIKVPFSGASYMEVDESIALALGTHPEVKMVVRGLDMNMLMLDKDRTAADPQTYPQYLYDDNVINDIKYVLNRDVFWSRSLPMLLERATGYSSQPYSSSQPAKVISNAKTFKPGITSFDDYQSWGDKFASGFDVVCPNGISSPATLKSVHLSEKTKKKVIANVQQNICDLANAFPNVDFYYFFTPYSAVWWRDLVDDGTIYQQVEAEQAAIEEILKCSNIKLFSFNTMSDITTNLDNYIEPKHYTAYVNDLILDFMKEGTGLLTSDNYQSYLDAELSLYKNLDYLALH